jgi:hypothetical protein
MNFVSVISVVLLGGAVAAFNSHRALKAGTTPGEVAMFGAAALLAGGGVFLYLFVLSSMLGEKPSEYLAPSLFGSKGERSILFLYAISSAGLTALVAAGIARVISSGKA